MAVQGANGDMVDLESSLLQQFSCLATQDKDVLINQFQKLLSPNQLSPEGCAFFLDMNNWNLQQAICSYFDLDAPRELGMEALPNMSFIKDVTIGEGEEVPPNTRFVKTWRIQNSGTEKWPPGCSLRFINGHLMGNCERVVVDPLEPGQMADVSLEMVSPAQSGIYQGQWRMSTAIGQFFGEIIWVIITVAEGGLLSLTQQMDSFHQLGSPVESHPSKMDTSVNPFASRTNRLKTEDTSDQSRYFSWPSNPSNNWSSSDCPQEGNSSSGNNIVATMKDTESDQINDASVSEKNQIPLGQIENKNLSISESNHLPPTPPPSEDMML